MKILLFILFSSISLSFIAQQKKTRILFILDASNSMNSKWVDNQTRIQAAKELLIKSVDSLVGVPNLEIALRVYGHQSPITTTYQDCQDTKLEVPFGTDNHLAIKSKVLSITAKGTTPIARSLEAAAGDFPDTTTRNFIILITDGLEACDNDPCVIAKKLKDKGVNVTPFVIGLGMDLSYLDKFNCIGSYFDAETKNTFQNALKTVISKTLLNTTVQINLNDIQKNPKETNVTLFLYEAGTKKLKYTFTHTLNHKNNPDTLILDPAFKYDLVVNTLPKIEKKNIEIKRNMHNTIIVDAPQGFIKVRFLNASKPYHVEARIMQENDSKTINVQQINDVDKYIVGKYKLEILTLPRIYADIEVNQSIISNFDILAPGNFYYKTTRHLVGQIFVINSDGTFEWVYNLNQESFTGEVQLQPGHYKLVYRDKNSKSTNTTIQKDFYINSNKTTSLNL